MADLFRVILIMSLTGSIIALLLFGLRPLIRHHIPKYAQYYLWLVVIAALLVPVSQFISLPGNEAAVPAVPSITDTVSRFVITQAEETQRLESLAPLSIANPSVYQLERQAVESPIAIITTYFVLLYPFGVLILLLYYVIHYAIFMGLYRRRNISAGPDVVAMLEYMCQGRPPRLYYNALADTPMLFGVFRPAIILPLRDYTRAEMQAILSHELTHLRRKDVLVKWLALIATALHFFNPIVWLARQEIDRACELSCDEAVTGSMDGHSLRHYGNTLILVAANPKTPRAIASATMSEDKKNLKERLSAIMKRRKHTRYVIILSAMLILATIGLAACLGAGRNESQTPAETDHTPYANEDDAYNDDSYFEAEHPGPEDIPTIELELQMAPAEEAMRTLLDRPDFVSYYEMDFRVVHSAYWDSDLDWLTHESNAAIWANQPLHNFQIIGIYLGHSNDGITAHVTHAYYEMDVLDAPLFISWFFTTGLFPNNGISFTDPDGVQRYFAIWAGYGHEDSAPFTLTEFVDGGYLVVRLEEDEDPVERTAASYIVPVLIDGDFDITIPFIAPGEVILLGVLDFEPGDEYRLEIFNTEGNGMFAGITNTPDPASARPNPAEAMEYRTWRPRINSVPGLPLGIDATHYGNGYVYLFVGSLAVPDTEEPGYELFNVSVSIRTENQAQTEPPVHGTPLLIDGDFDITIPFIAPGEIVFVGVLDFEPGDIYTLTLYADIARGAFVGITNTPDLTSGMYGSWRGAVFGAGSHTQTHFGHGYRYLFIGSTAVVPPDSYSDFELINVSVSLRVISNS